MRSPNLRSKIIRLAHTNPALRPHLLPLLREASRLSLWGQWEGRYAILEKGAVFVVPVTGGWETYEYRGPNTAPRWGVVSPIYPSQQAAVEGWVMGAMGVHPNGVKYRGVPASVERVSLAPIPVGTRVAVYEVEMKRHRVLDVVEFSSGEFEAVEHWRGKGLQKGRLPGHGTTAQEAVQDWARANGYRDLGGRLKTV